MQIVLLALGLLVGALLGWFAATSSAHARRVQDQAAHDLALRDLATRPTELPDGVLSEADHLRALSDLEREHTVARDLAAEELSVKKAEVAAARESVLGLRDAVQRAEQQLHDVREQHRREAKDREARQQADAAVLEKLAPVAKQLGDMRRKVDEIEEQRSRQHGQLAEQLRVTHATAAQSKQAAEALASALKNNSVRGRYGETQLRTLVESAGLLNRVDFEEQVTIATDDGPRRPDMLVHLPGGKSLAIDAKVPYMSFIAAYETTDDEERRDRLRVEHAKQVRAHVDALASRQYWSGLSSSPELTVAFIPNEGILNDALDADPTLMEHAFAKGIALATPVNLWTVLKTVAFTWKQEALAEDAQRLVDLGRELYKRLGTMGGHVLKLGRSLDRTVGDYNKFVGSMERQVLSTARKLDAVDEAALLPHVPEIESDARELKASEFSLFADLDRPEIDPAVVHGEVVDDDRRSGTA